MRSYNNSQHEKFLVELVNIICCLFFNSYQKLGSIKKHSKKIIHQIFLSLRGYFQDLRKINVITSLRMTTSRFANSYAAG